MKNSFSKGGMTVGKIVRVFIFIFIILSMTSCAVPYSSTTSMLVITEKGHSIDSKEYWIKAYDPNNETEEEAVKIVVNEVMAWNLLAKEIEYFATYGKEGNNPITLTQIEYSEKNNLE